MANEENQQACVNETKKSPLQIPQVFNRLVQLPIVKSTCEKVSGMYGRTKEYSLFSMVGLSAAEASINAVVVAAKVTYTSLPSSGVMGKVKEGFEKKVFQADSMACDGLTFLENKWPLIKDNTEQVIAIGAKKLEQSDIAEVLLTVTEAAIEYFIPPKEKCIEEGAAESPVCQSKVDRIWEIVNVIKSEGEKVITRAASVPGRVTVAAIDCAKAVATWSWGISQILLQKVTVMERIVRAFWDVWNATKRKTFFFLPSFLGGGEEGKERLGRRKNPKRSPRYKPKAEYSRIIDASQPFPVSPERKRRYDREDEDNASIVELIHVSEDYISDEDPDYVPDKADLEKSESSEDEDDDDEDDDDEDEEKKIEDGDNDEIETVEKTESKKSPPESEEKSNPEESKETEEERKKERNGEVKKTPKINISVKDEKKTESKGGEPNNSQKNNGKEVDDKEPDLQEKYAKMAAKRGEKSGSPRKGEGRIVL